MSLEFGPPKNFLEAFNRLPDRSNPLYDTDTIIHSLANFRERLEFILITNPNPDGMSIESRSSDLTLEQFAFIEKVSFKRFREIYTNSHTYTESNTEFAEMFSTNDDHRGTWKIYTLTPDIQDVGYGLFAIFFHLYMPQYGFPPNEYLFKQSEWHIEVTIAKTDEINSLVNDLKSH